MAVAVIKVSAPHKFTQNNKIQMKHHSKKQQQKTYVVKRVIQLSTVLT